MQSIKYKIFTGIILVLLMSCTKSKGGQTDPKLYSQKIINLILEQKYSELKDQYMNDALLTVNLDNSRFIQGMDIFYNILKINPPSDSSIFTVRSQNIKNPYSSLKIDQDSIEVSEVNIQCGIKKMDVVPNYFLVISLITKPLLKTPLLDITIVPAKMEKDPQFQSNPKLNIKYDDLQKISFMHEGGHNKPDYFLGLHCLVDTIKNTEMISDSKRILELLGSLEFVKMDTNRTNKTFLDNPSMDIISIVCLDGYNYFIFNFLEEPSFNEKYNYLQVFQCQTLECGYTYYFKKNKQLSDIMQRACSKGANERNGERKPPKLEFHKDNAR